MRVVVLGASGFIGRRLTAALAARGDDVVGASLRDPLSAARTADRADAVVNLAGAPVARRWSERQKEAIVRSRTELPRRFLDALAALPQPPRTYVSASAVGYYGTSLTATFTESSPPGDDFLGRSCVAWETEARRAEALGMRVALVRTGLALGAEGGALARLLPLFRARLGGVVASGAQWYSWVHVDDVVGIYLHLLDGDARGPYNATAPNPVTNREFTRALAAAVRRPAFLPVPALAVRAILGEGATIVVDGQRVVPERTLASGYAFRYPEVGAALRAVAG